jgi:hypothetical protein
MTFKEIDGIVKHYEEEIDGCVDLMKNINKNLKKEKDEKVIAAFEHTNSMLEFACFVSACYIDLLCTYRNLRRAKTEWEYSYNAKIAYLLIYETINTYHKYQKKIYQEANKIEKENYNHYFQMLNDELREFKEDYGYDKIMSRIRNKSIAHYDRNFIDFYENYEILKDKKSNDVIESFFYFMKPLLHFSYGLIGGNINRESFALSWLM